MARAGKTFAEEIGDDILELLPLVERAEFDLLYEIIGQIEGRLHLASLLVDHLLSTRLELGDPYPLQ